MAKLKKRKRKGGLAKAAKKIKREIEINDDVTNDDVYFMSVHFSQLFKKLESHITLDADERIKITKAVRHTCDTIVKGGMVPFRYEVNKVGNVSEEDWLTPTGTHRLELLIIFIEDSISSNMILREEI